MDKSIIALIVGAVSTLFSIILFSMRRKNKRKEERMKKADEALEKLRESKDSSDIIDAWNDMHEL